ncbi:hypothetical protein BSKO_08570 [Bryopsis sp. KO-2023]|nr:hypothetical protein BSKO_08570 [Bryopsis sp. KO-2023]
MSLVSPSITRLSVRAPRTPVQRTSAVNVRCHQTSQANNVDKGAKPAQLARRGLLLGSSLFCGVSLALPSLAFVRPPPGFRIHRDRLDGYSFFVPERWVQTTTAGNDVAYRDPVKIDENLFVNISSPSSSKYSSVADLGSPADAGDRILKQLLTEFMSTRIGIRREGEVVNTTERTGSDGKLYYDVQVRIRSYASRSQLAVSAAERDAAIELEWDRKLTTVLGVANKRLYEFRLQSDALRSDDQSAAAIMPSVESFRCQEVEI